MMEISNIVGGRKLGEGKEISNDKQRRLLLV